MILLTLLLTSTKVVSQNIQTSIVSVQEGGVEYKIDWDSNTVKVGEETYHFSTYNTTCSMLDDERLVFTQIDELDFKLRLLQEVKGRVVLMVVKPTNKEIRSYQPKPLSSKLQKLTVL